MRPPCLNDHIIMKLISDPNYVVQEDGVICSRVARTGKVYVDPSKWRTIGTSKDGRLHLKYQGKTLVAARVVYARHCGALHPDLVVYHKDGNSMNNHPSNLVLGPMKESNLNRYKTKPPVIGNAVLNWTAVRLIRARRKELKWTYKQLCEEFKISKGHVSMIVNNLIWIEEKDYHGFPAKRGTL